MDFRKLASWSEVEYGIAMARLARETVLRGFTTVRDLGGDVEGLMRAIATGMTLGPRICRAGLMLTQTGGHGDAERGPRPVPQCACEMRHTAFGIVADGVDAHLQRLSNAPEVKPEHATLQPLPTHANRTAHEARKPPTQGEELPPEPSGPTEL